MMGCTSGPLKTHITYPEGSLPEQVQEEIPREPANPGLPGKLLLEWTHVV